MTAAGRGSTGDGAPETAGVPDAIVELNTELGPARMVVAAAAQPRSLLMLGHGAGGGVDSDDLTALARALPLAGITVARFEQPWRTAGKRVAPAPARLDVGWAAAMQWAERSPWSGLPLFLGGRSAGARVACRSAAESAGDRISGVLCLAFPVHPPGKPEKTRLPELLSAGRPTLVLQGSKDTFGSAEQLRQEVGQQGSITVTTVPDVGHDFRPPKSSPVTAADIADLVTGQTKGFVAGLLRAG